jgi:tetratricopeptide (TPR) repeat protein
MPMIGWERSKRNLRTGVRRRLAPPAAAFLVAAAIAGAVCVMPAAADFAGDQNVCNTVSNKTPAEKVAACTRLIDSGRLSGQSLAAVYANRADRYRLLEQYDRALEDFDRAFKLNAGNPFMYLNRAEVWRLMGKDDQAIADATRAIELDPALNSPWAIRGMIYEKIGAIAKAREDFKRALAIPVKANDGNWAQDIARERLKALEGK